MKKDKDFPAGELILINKPLHWTSFQVVNKVRWLIKRKLQIKKIKVGHAGTLDPLASGLMILCTGKKTKEIHLYQAQEKEYRATLKLGATTPSYDGETAENYFSPTKHITHGMIKECLRSFLGDTLQRPPIFSALKIGGKKLYESARKGKEVEIKSRTIRIKEIEVEKIEMPYISFRLVCSKGTYIRSLAYDIGRALNCGAWLYKLERTKIGDQDLKSSIDLQDFQEQMK
jgi:tRNA pseudouridine55 synthase